MTDTAILGEYTHCELCPNACGANRLKGEKGVCGETARVRIAWSGLHRGEEPPVKGSKGSGMIFFCGCPLHCAYCQNWQISTGGEAGIEVSVEELAGIMLGLQDMGAQTLNLVTPTHFYPSIIPALHLAREKGLRLDVVNNSSGYESGHGLDLFDPYTDLWLIDVKTLRRSTAAKFCGRAQYADEIEGVMRRLVLAHPKTEMRRGRLRGLLVRHLLFPGEMASTLEFLEWYKKNLDAHAWLSLMVQFVPPRENPGFKDVTEEEYDTLIAKLEELGIDNGYVQDLADNIPWIPDFTKDVPFPASFADPLPLFLALKHEREKKQG